MTDESDDPHGPLAEAHQALIDSSEGYREACGNADPGVMKALFESVLAEKRAAVLRVGAILRERGVAVDGEPSMIGALTRNIVWVRAGVAGDESLLPGMIDGEKRVCERLRSALRSLPFDDPAKADLMALIEEEEGLIAMLERRNAA